jgi:CheY-like chemotaxis protein/transcriptional regulator with XRE-family HTH domain
MAGCHLGPFDRSLADRVRFARRVAGMSKSELAAAIDTRVSQLRRYESGADAISASTLLRIAVALDAPLGWLYGVDDSDQWPDTLLALLFRDPHMPALVSSFARVPDGAARRLLVTMAQELASHSTPRPPSPFRPQAVTVSAPSVPAGRPRRALLVDDAPDMLVVVGAFLRSDGYDVVRADGAEAALEILRGGEPLDLLVTDYAMPGMNGLELVRCVAGLRPGLAAVVITAVAAELALAAGRLPGVAVLAKPFARVDLLNAVQAVCARAQLDPREA